MARCKNKPRNEQRNEGQSKIFVDAAIHATRAFIADRALLNGYFSELERLFIAHISPELPSPITNKK